MAIESYVKNHQNQSLLDEINRAISEQPDLNDTVYKTKMRKSHHKILDGEW